MAQPTPRTVAEFADLLAETIQQAAAGRIPAAVSGPDVEIGSIIQADLDDGTSDIEIAVGDQVFQITVEDVTAENAARRAARRAA